jgi:hypothetical protein
MPQPIDEDPGKPVHIWTRTGCKPLLAGGNADGDAAMLRTARFGLLIRHDDRCGAPPGGTISGRWGREYLLVDHRGEGFQRLPARGGEAHDRGTDGPRQA